VYEEPLPEYLGISSAYGHAGLTSVYMTGLKRAPLHRKQETPHHPEERWPHLSEWSRARATNFIRRSLSRAISRCHGSRIESAEVCLAVCMAFRHFHLPSSQDICEPANIRQNIPRCPRTCNGNRSLRKICNILPPPRPQVRDGKQWPRHHSHLPVSHSSQTALWGILAYSIKRRRTNEGTG